MDACEENLVKRPRNSQVCMGLSMGQTPNLWPTSLHRLKNTFQIIEHFRCIKRRQLIKTDTSSFEELGMLPGVSAVFWSFVWERSNTVK